MLKNRWLIPLTATLLLFAGCGDTAQEKTPTKSGSQTPQIKVTKGAVDTTVAKSEDKSNSGQFYYSYNKEKNVTEEPPKTRTTIDAYLNIKSPYERVRITMMIKRLSDTYVRRCSPCHDDYANGVIGPSLLDKNATFIYNRIMDFKTGRKKNVLMKELVEQMNDAQIKSIAEEIANFNKEIRKMRRGK